MARASDDGLSGKVDRAATSGAIARTVAIVTFIPTAMCFVETNRDSELEDGAQRRRLGFYTGRG